MKKPNAWVTIITVCLIVAITTGCSGNVGSLPPVSISLDNSEAVLNDKIPPVQLGPDVLLFPAILTFTDINSTTANRMGYIDSAGSVVLTGDYLLTRPFCEGLAAVYTADAKWQYINTAGKVQFDGASFDYAFEFSEGCARVIMIENETSVHYILNAKQQELIFLEDVYGAGYGYPFNEGALAVKTMQSDTAGGRGFVGTNGELLFKPVFGYATTFSEGLAAVATYEEHGQGQLVYVNHQGEIVINTGKNYDVLYNAYYNFSEGLAYIRDGQYINIEGHVFIDLADKYPGTNFDGREFSEGLAGVCVDGKWGFIDTTGIMVIEPQFWNVGDFSEGLAAVYDGTGKVGFINTKGELVVDYLYVDTTHTRQITIVEYEPGYTFRGGLAQVYYDDAVSEWFGYIDKKGNIVYQNT